MLFGDLIARGYQPPPDEEVPVRCVTGGGRVAGDGLLPAGLETGFAGGAGLGVLCPTYVSRCNAEEHARHLGHLLEQIAGVRELDPGRPLLLVVGMQWRPGEEDEAEARLAALGRLAAAECPGLAYVGLSLAGPGKIRTINAAVRLARPLGLAGWLWVDDDVHFEERCLRRVVARFLERGATGAVGATKVTFANDRPASRWLRAVKRATRPPRNYPNACCMAVAAEVVAGGIPPRRITDDGFVFFELFGRDPGDPFRDLELVPDALCRVYVGGGSRETLRNLRRGLYSHLTSMADYPRLARPYARLLLFHGLWPIGAWDGRHGLGAGLLRWTVKAAYLAWFAAEGLALALRGLVRRPLRGVAWGSYSTYEVPEPTLAAPREQAAR